MPGASGNWTRADMEHDLRLMLRYVGLGDMPTSELGANHPYEGPMVETELGLRPAPTVPPTERPKPVRPKYPPAILREKDAEKSIPKAGIKRSDPHRRPPLPEDLCIPVQDKPNPIEMARRISVFQYRHGLNITQTARALGRSRAYVRNHLRLLDLPETIKDHVEAGRLTEAHARVIVKMRDPEVIARLIIRRRLSVRQTELIARRLRYIGPDGTLLRETAIPNRQRLEEVMEDVMGLKVRVHDRAGRGKIEIFYNSPAEAQSIVNGLGQAFTHLTEADLSRDY